MKTLTNGNQTVIVAPEFGSALYGHEFTANGRTWKTGQPKSDKFDPNLRDDFATAPWFGRVPNMNMNCANVTGVNRELVLTHPADPKMALHGIVRQRPHRIVCSTESSIHTIYEHDAAECGGYNWFGPFTHETIVSFPTDFTMEIVQRLTNTGSSAFPVVLAQHPMFRRAKGMMFEFNARQILEMDKQTLVPNGDSVPIPAQLDFTTLACPPGDLEVMFVDWDGHALINYPNEYEVLIADNSKKQRRRCLMAWHLDGKEVCALENVTGTPNAGNRMNSGLWGGGTILKPGEVEVLGTIYTYCSQS